MVGVPPISSTFRHLCMLWNVYSKTSNNGPSEKRTTSLQRTAHLPPIDFTIELIHYEPPRRGQPVYKGQMAHPQSVLCSEVLLYYVMSNKWFCYCMLLNWFKFTLDWSRTEPTTPIPPKNNNNNCLCFAITHNAIYVCVCMCVCMYACMYVWTINEPHLPYKTGLDVMQSHPLRRTRLMHYTMKT